ncbi:MAG TPA: hypothetical protein VII75_01785 [Thermoanaerobaculia bacterium]|nr:hypothetical protein [Thermoanaerobaculia bacterium]
MVITKPGMARPVIIKMDKQMGEDIVRSNMRTLGLSRHEFERLLAIVRGQNIEDIGGPLEVAPDERPNSAPGGRAASPPPRCTASRRSHRALQMQASGVPLCPQARDYLSRVNL